MTTFVLIPGAGADPRVYAATIEALRELGHEGIAPDLPRDDDGATPSDHAAAVVAAAEDLEEIVVVGQSLGAFAAPIAAERLKAQGLILVAPMIPAPGETAGEWGANVGHEEAIADLRERFGSPGEWGEEAMVHAFLHDVDPETIAATAGLNGPAGNGLFSEPWPLPAWPAVPTRVIAPTEDRFFPLEFQCRVTHHRLGLDVDEIPGGHVPMLSRPRELAARLVELA
jgi:pimeloyl-ACP methyl ester carboxylesterase